MNMFQKFKTLIHFGSDKMNIKYPTMYFIKKQWHSSLYWTLQNQRCQYECTW